MPNPFAPKTRAVRDAERKAAADRNFAAFMAAPTTKLAFSLIPGGETPEALQLLVRAAFDAGFTTGAGIVVGEMMEAVLGNELRRSADGE